MKIKVSISMEKELHKLVKDKVANSVFRNTSHLIEYAVESFLKEAKNE